MVIDFNDYQCLLDVFEDEGLILAMEASPRRNTI
ncbi:hypothetical protein [Scytonema sp. NUACC26]